MTNDGFQKTKGSKQSNTSERLEHKDRHWQKGPTVLNQPPMEKPNDNRSKEGNFMDKQTPKDGVTHRDSVGNRDHSGNTGGQPRSRGRRPSAPRAPHLGNSAPHAGNSAPHAGNSANVDRGARKPQGNRPFHANKSAATPNDMNPRERKPYSRGRLGAQRPAAAGSSGAYNAVKSPYPLFGADASGARRGGSKRTKPAQQEMPYFPSDHVIRDRYSAYQPGNQYEGLPKDDDLDDFEDDTAQQAVSQQPASPPPSPKRASLHANQRSSAHRNLKEKPVVAFKSRVPKAPKEDRSFEAAPIETDFDMETDAAELGSEKLHKVIAKVGLASRREAEEWIALGRVKVNGVIAKVGDRITDDDQLEVDGQFVDFELDDEESSRRFILYHKPEGEVCTRTDPEGRPTVYDRLPSLQGERWVVVGRLDLSTSGLLLFTTDGNFANRLMHPSSMVEREYAVRVFGEVTDQTLQHLSSGVELEDGPAKFSRIVEAGGEGKNHWFHVTLAEGRNREVRRMWESQNLTVSRLIRVRYGHLVLPRDLKAGQWVELNEADINKLAETVGIRVRRGTGLFGRGRLTTSSIAAPAADRLGARRGGFLRRRRY
jgi:23S rRNA pseudouridine2605 synthase